MGNKIALRPSYWASVSGSKDSLYMLNLILHMLPLKWNQTILWILYPTESDVRFMGHIEDYNKMKKYFGIAGTGKC